ncbi:MAG: hypothetical protein BWY74_04336 [Firmicutes bacterium ADurb.Bin419]|nr:MAG: hypothetical protein BWY74_04336 [Firmicutes bacterium ADurb.Bin419]
MMYMVNVLKVKKNMHPNLPQQKFVILRSSGWKFILVNRGEGDCDGKHNSK